MVEGLWVGVWAPAVERPRELQQHLRLVQVSARVEAGRHIGCAKKGPNQISRVSRGGMGSPAAAAPLLVCELRRAPYPYSTLSNHCTFDLQPRLAPPEPLRRQAP